MNYCRDGGLIVGGCHPLPEDPTVYAAPEEVVGCNRLQCYRCGAFVRSALGFCHASFGGDLALAYDTADWSTLPFIDKSARTGDDRPRLYLCRCFAEATDSSEGLESWQDRHEVMAPPPWRCTGHPHVGIHVRVEGTDISGSTDFHEAAARALRADDEKLSDRIYARIAGTVMQESLARSIADHLRSPDATIQRRALEFFARHPDAPAAARVETLLRDGGVAQVNRESARVALAGAVTSHRTGGPRAVELIALARSEALLPGAPAPLLSALVANDPGWVREHAVDLAAGTPSLLRELLVLLQRADVDVTAFGLAAARSPLLDRAALRSLVERFVELPAARARIVAALADVPAFAPSLALHNPDALRGEAHLACVYQSWVCGRWYVIPPEAELAAGRWVLEDCATVRRRRLVTLDEATFFEVAHSIALEHRRFAWETIQPPTQGGR